MGVGSYFRVPKLKDDFSLRLERYNAISQAIKRFVEELNAVGMKGTTI